MKFNRAFVLLFSVTSMFGLATIFGSQLVSPQLVSAKSLKPKKTIIEIAPGTSRTFAQMGVSLKRKTSQKIQRPRPTINPATYARLKAQADAGLRSASAKPKLPSASPTPRVPAVSVNCNGASNVDGLTPPDTHGAVGATQFVEVTNSRLTVYSKSAACPLPVKNVSLASFFGYTATTIFDPRAVYDSTWKRFVIVADTFNQSATVQTLLIAVSKTSSATGGFWIYAVDIDIFDNNAFFDYPQLGLDQNSVLITGNIFPAAGGFAGADLLSMAKARLYNGLGFSVPVFTGLAATLAPPVVLDQNANTFLVAAQPADNKLSLYRLTNSSNAFQASLTLQATPAVPAYLIPPNAPQPGTAVTLDTLDNRFQNASTQIGNSLWQVHTQRLAGFAAPKFYEINTAANTITQSLFFFAAGPSHDFNPSIAANASNDAFVTWSSTLATPTTNAQVRAGSCVHTAGCAFGAGINLFTSPTFLSDSGNPNRWGDYSAVTIDPANPTRAWVVNEKVNSTSVWGSRYGAITGF